MPSSSIDVGPTLLASSAARCFDGASQLVVIVALFARVGTYILGAVKSLCLLHRKATCSRLAHSGLCRCCTTLMTDTLLVAAAAHPPCLAIPLSHGPGQRGRTQSNHPRKIWLDRTHLVLVKAAIVVVSIESGPSYLVQSPAPGRPSSHFKNPSNLLAVSISRVDVDETFTLGLLARLQGSDFDQIPHARYHRDLFTRSTRTSSPPYSTCPTETLFNLVNLRVHCLALNFTSSRHRQLLALLLRSPFTACTDALGIFRCGRS